MMMPKLTEHHIEHMEATIRDSSDEEIYKSMNDIKLVYSLAASTGDEGEVGEDVVTIMNLCIAELNCRLEWRRKAALN